MHFLEGGRDQNKLRTGGGYATFQLKVVDTLNSILDSASSRGDL